MNNSNLLIIGYGFADYYINNVLNQFRQVHKSKARVNIIDFADENNWNKKVKQKDPNIISDIKFRTLYNIFKDKQIQEMLQQDFVSPQIFNNGKNHLFLRGFKDAANTIKLFI